ncbi:MAG: ferritin-like domain-containing protein [Deltaproteobacteria bacterium]|nr:ferritin-like domain-containing protein [Deltaproteobacteria bacterium]
MSAQPVNADHNPFPELDAYSSPMEIAWQFDYEIDSTTLKNLYSKSKQRQWDAELQLPWDTEIDPSKPIVGEDRFMFHRVPFFQKLSKKQRDDFTAHATCQLLSQFLHGEQGALMTAAAVTHAAPDYEAKLYSATQTMDEARHVEVYDLYIKKLGMVYPMSPWLKKLIDVTLQSQSFAKTMVGMNMVVEGLALAAFHNMRMRATCPLLKALTELVLQDESRHVAFGNIYLRDVIKDMHDDEKEDIAQFAFDAVKIMADSNGGAEGDGPRQMDPSFLKVLENCDIDPGDFIKGMIEAGQTGIDQELPPGQIHSFKDLMMPALVRVGAVTKRSRELYAEAGIPVYDDVRILESMEDKDTGDIEIPNA